MWIVLNEIISILENLVNIEIDLPPISYSNCKEDKKEAEEFRENKEGL